MSSTPSTPLALPPSSSTNPFSPPITPPDYTLPISTLLREGTKSAHTTAEHSAGAIALATGTLPVQEYLRYLIVLWCVYAVLEEELDRIVESENQGEEVDAVRAVWKQKGGMLRRKAKLEEDILYFLHKIEQGHGSDSKFDRTLAASAAANASSTLPIPTYPVPAFLRSMFLLPSKDLTGFTSHLRQLGSSSPALLLSHAYVRYLGDLSGGQFIALKIRRLYNLEVSEKGTGLMFYEFDLDSPTEGQEQSATTSASEESESKFDRMRKVDDIKNWFRDTIDAGVGGDEVLKAQLVEEANNSFQLSTRLFFLLQAPPLPTPPAGNATPVAPAPAAAAAATAPAHTGQQTKTSNIAPANSTSTSTTSIWWSLAAVVFFLLANYASRMSLTELETLKQSVKDLYFSVVSK